jgi:hypothetical protein
MKGRYVMKCPGRVIIASVVFFFVIFFGASGFVQAQGVPSSGSFSEGSEGGLSEEQAADLLGQPGVEFTEIAIPVAGGGFVVGSEEDLVAALQAIQAPIPVTYKKLTVDKTGNGLVTSAPKGINCGTTCFFDFKTGSKVNLTAKADVGWIFSGWSESACTGTKPCGVLMNDTKVITATFTPGTPDILVTPADTTKHFGNTRSGTTKSATYTVKNKGTGMLAMGQILSIANQQFTVPTITDKCSGVSLAPNKTCTFKVLFKPVYGDYCGCTGQVDVSSNDKDTPKYSIWFCGCGT